MSANATGKSHGPVGAAEPEVRTTAGAVRGRWEDGLAVFRGIPFAEPPVGAARFAVPQPVRSWHGVREAFSFGPAPPQDETGFPEALRRTKLPKQPVGDEWLTVNVWTPDLDPAARRPVMVWIYGGAYKLGFSGSYDARRISRAGDLVVVSFNYAASASRGSPGSTGLWLTAACSIRSPPSSGCGRTSPRSAATLIKLPPSANRLALDASPRY